MSIPMIPTRSPAVGFASPLPDEREPDTAELPLPLEELDWPEGALAWLQQLKPADPEPAGRQRLPTRSAPDNFAALAASPLTLSSPIPRAGAVHGLPAQGAGLAASAQAQVPRTATPSVAELTSPDRAALSRSEARQYAPSASATANLAMPMNMAQPLPVKSAALAGESRALAVADATDPASSPSDPSALTRSGLAVPGPTASAMALVSAALAAEASASLDTQVIPASVLPGGHAAPAQRTPVGQPLADAGTPRPNQGPRMPTLPASPAGSGSAPYLQVSFDNGVKSGSISVFQPPTGPTSLQPALLQLQPSNPELRAYLHEQLVSAQQPWQLGDESGRGQQRQPVPGDDDQDDAQQQPPRHQDDEEQSA